MSEGSESTAPPARSKATPLALGFFAVLVVVTAGAFVVTQALKGSDPVVERVFFAKYLSPNGDGFKDTVDIRFDLPQGDDATVSIVDEDGKEVRRLATDRHLRKGTHKFRWDGRNDDGDRAPDGDYRLRVLLNEEGRGLTAARALVLDTTPPRPRLIAATPAEIAPGAPSPRGRVRIRFSGPSDPAPEFRVYRTDDGPVREVARFDGTRFRRIAFWDGKIDGKPAPDGIYAFGVVVRDRAFVAGSAPPRLPPTRAEARPETGSSVRRVTIEGPLEPVRAGKVARFTIGPALRPVRWSVAPFTGGPLVRRGLTEGKGTEFVDKRRNRRGTKVSFRVPQQAKSGLYLLRVTTGGAKGVAPLVVRGRTNGTRPGPGRILVVLPTISWQGATRVDDNGDGFAETLYDSPEVRLQRPLAGARLPLSTRENLGPLLRFLAREKVAYDLTTDVALARSGGEGLRDHSGVILAGSERWITPTLDNRFKEYVEGGGRIANFGADSLKRTVKLEKGLLRDPVGPRIEDTFGEQTENERTPAAPLVVSKDEIDMFRAADRFVGEFTRIEQSVRRAKRAKLKAAAGREKGKPAFVAYDLGFGLVVRTGAPGWSTLLAEDRQNTEVIHVTRRILRLLSRESLAQDR